MVSQSVEDTRAIAARFAERWRAAMSGRAAALVVALEGELGAGKTTFVQAVAAALGIREVLRSPTFNLVKVYPIPGSPYRLVHVDCYRLEGRADLAPMDLHALFEDPMNLVFVEWPERIGRALPADRIVIRMAHAGGDKRSLTTDAQPKRT